MSTSRLQQFSRGVMGVVVALAGWLVLNAVACHQGGCQSERRAKAVEQKEDHTTKGGSDERGGATDEGLPGEVEAGKLEPKAPGPKAPAIFVMAGLKGYLEPCGCTADILLGGAERIVGYVKAARRLYEETLMVDGGDTFFEVATLEEHEKPQERAKAKVVAEVQNQLGTRWTVPGERDFALGVEFYRKMIEKAGVEPLGANVRLGGEALEAAVTAEVGGWTVGVVGAAQPSLYADVPEGTHVEVGEASPAVGKALESKALADSDVQVLLLHGGLKAAKELLEAHPALDFVVVGHDPRETDQVDRVAGGATLEAYDQGRYVGVLTLYGAGASGDFKNVSPGSKAAREKLKKRLEHVRESIRKVESGLEDGQEAPPILERLKSREKKLARQTSEAAGGGIEVPEGERAFAWRSVAMKPGYPVDAEIRKKRKAFNRRLKALSKQVDREIPPVEEGQATYIGTNQCQTCHGAAHDFWGKTEHAGAVQTLKKRDKLFDHKCIGCHVVGYEKPGGSVLGKLEYEATVDGQSLTKDLRNVGCESCHGPGSKHRAAPIGADGQPQHIVADPGREACMECHVPEHSPSFEFESYVQKITGPGHERSSRSGE